MPFDAVHNVVYGDDAMMPGVWGSGVLMDFWRDKLNDPDGPYYAPLGLSDTRKVRVTDIQRIADVLYKEQTISPPIVFVMQGPQQSRKGGRTVGGVEYPGWRWDIVLEVDCGVNDAAPSVHDAAAEGRADKLLAAFLKDSVKRHRQELVALGLGAVTIQSNAEAQRAGRGRNPHTVNFICTALDDYTP